MSHVKAYPFKFKFKKVRKQKTGVLNRDKTSPAANNFENLLFCWPSPRTEREDNSSDYCSAGTIPQVLGPKQVVVKMTHYCNLDVPELVTGFEVKTCIFLEIKYFPVSLGDENRCKR